MLESLKMRKWPSEQKVAYWEKEIAERKLEKAKHQSAEKRLTEEIERLQARIKEEQ